MGRHRRTLAETTLRTKPKFCNSVRAEAGEEGIMHIHWRDMRILLDPVGQFDMMCNMTQNARRNWDRIERKFISGKDIYISRRTIPGDVIMCDELKIEESTSGVIHFHYRDIRLELSPEDFLTMAGVFTAAASSYQNRQEQMIPMEEINPYDRRHQATREKWRRGTVDYNYHAGGIKIVKDGLQRGGQILPILITPVEGHSYEYQRLDGFKRYMAYKQLGREKIPCYVNKMEEVEPMRQDQMSFWSVTPLWEEVKE